MCCTKTIINVYWSFPLQYVRVSVDSRADDVLQLMLSEWQMDRPKLLISVQGGSENLILPPKVSRAFSKGLLTAALSTGAWILTDGINTGTSREPTKLINNCGSIFNFFFFFFCSDGFHDF